jgi:hypothetical protein
LWIHGTDHNLDNPGILARIGPGYFAIINRLLRTGPLSLVSPALTRYPDLMIRSLGKINNPADIISSSMAGGDCVAFEFDHTQYYSTGITITLGVVCYCAEDELRAAFSTRPESFTRAVMAQSGTPRRAYNNLLAVLGLTDIDLKAPLKLDTIRIPKPWGQEIWYTGIEARGVCAIQGVPLPWILEVFATIVTGTRNLTPILLKILDPFPQEIYGDLYFELHQTKREVYVVTHIDRDAWPDLVGKIRFGFSPEKISAYPDEQQFKDAYLNSVREYQRVREILDTEPDEIRAQGEVGENEVVPPETIRDWPGKIDPALLIQEKELRNAMNEYTAQRELRLGDVIHVNPFVPHSLQHGVRVIEFQTPHYERYILSFAQKVLTQDHWDTEKALELVQLHAEKEPDARQISGSESLIADFDEFKAIRIVLQAGSERAIDMDTYCLAIGVEGNLTMGEERMRPEDALYIPAAANSVTMINSGREPATLLIAYPA